MQDVHPLYDVYAIRIDPVDWIYNQSYLASDASHIDISLPLCSGLLPAGASLNTAGSTYNQQYRRDTHQSSVPVDCFYQSLLILAACTYSIPVPVLICPSVEELRLPEVCAHFMGYHSNISLSPSCCSKDNISSCKAISRIQLLHWSAWEECERLTNYSRESSSATSKTEHVWSSDLNRLWWGKYRDVLCSYGMLFPTSFEDFKHTPGGWVEAKLQPVTVCLPYCCMLHLFLRYSYSANCMENRCWFAMLEPCLGCVPG